MLKTYDLDQGSPTCGPRAACDPPVHEVETDQAKEVPDEIMDINPDSENKFEKSDEHETFKLTGKFSNAA
ncbi:hypothetical protein TNCV_4160101 [Trichonephila clavipes]|nr:hypothetical protein TNCV_4160101 [Trichonephila clavipes]